MARGDTSFQILAASQQPKLGDNSMNFTTGQDLSSPSTGQSAEAPSFDTWLQSPGALALAASLLKSSGPNIAPTSIGKAVGEGLDAMQSADVRETQRKLYESQGNEINMKIAAMKDSLDQRKAVNKSFTDAIKRETGVIPTSPLGASQQSNPSTTSSIPSAPLSSGYIDLSSAAPKSTLLNSDQLKSALVPPTQQAVSSSPQVPSPGGLLNQPTSSSLQNLGPVQSALVQAMIASGDYPKVYETLYGKAPEPYTLSENQTRFDQNNRAVSAGIPKDVRTNLEKNAVAEGFIPGTPAYQARVQAVEDHEKTTVNIPAGYTYSDPNNPNAGLKVIPGGPADAAKNPEDAGKTQLLRNAQNQLDSYSKLLFDENGNPNRTNIWAANPTGVPYFKDIPFSEGRHMKDVIGSIVEGVARSSQKRMGPEDIRMAKDRFTPKPGDNADTVKFKFDQAKDFVNGALGILDPANKLSEPRFNRSSPTSASSNYSSISDDQIRKILGTPN